MKTELELVKALLLSCKLISEVRDIGKEGLNPRDEISHQKPELPRARALRVLKSVIATAIIALLKGSGIGSDAVALAEQAVALLR
jgi:hypothetical protein